MGDAPDHIGVGLLAGQLHLLVFERLEERLHVGIVVGIEVLDMLSAFERRGEGKTCDKRTAPAVGAVNAARWRI